jgi:hypothetical protein
MHFAHRFSGEGGVYEGLTVLRPKDAKRPGVDWSGSARFVPEMLGEPLKWRKPQRVFVNSMSDLFHESLTNEEIATVFAVMASCQRHTFQILTKRPKRAAEWFTWVQNQQGDEGTLHARVTCYLSAARKDRAAALVAFQAQLRPPWPEGGKWPLPTCGSACRPKTRRPPTSASCFCSRCRRPCGSSVQSRCSDRSISLGGYTEAPRTTFA